MRLISPSLLLTLPITLTVTSVLASSSSKTPTGTTTADTNPNAKSGNAAPNANAASNNAGSASANASGSGVEIPQLGTIIQRANTLLTTGQFNDAARTYTEALDLSPNDYVLYFKRATAYLSSNRHSPALDDFDKVLQLTDGTFDGAVIAKAKIYTKEGRWEESREALTAYSKRVPGDKAAQELMFSVADGEQATNKANKAQKSGKWDECIEQSTHALQIATYSASLRQQRADCALSAGDVEQAIADLTRLTHLGVSSTPLLLRISSLAYFMSPPSAQGMQTLKQCLHFDPDSKPCKAAHRIVKALDKQFAELEKAGEDAIKVLKIVITESTGLAAKFDQALTDAMAAMDPPLPSNIVPSRISQRRAVIWRAACKSYIQLNDVRKGERWCAELLRMDKDDLDGLVGSGEAALKNEEWDEAIRLFDRAFEASGKSSHDIHQRLQKAQRLRKQAKKKDYYKVLGVSRDADPKTIKRAYRKAAMNAHPDKGGSETKMAAVNEAYEVLSKPELRQRYDNGDDPNDPESQQGGHPFHGSPFQFFQQGGGGPFSHQGGQQFHFQWGH